MRKTIALVLLTCAPAFAVSAPAQTPAVPVAASQQDEQGRCQAGL